MEELPLDFAAVPIDSLVLLIADMLERLMAHNDLIPLLPESLTRFHSRSAPGISVLDYLRRIVRFTNVEKSCLLITLHYIDQICARMPLFTLSSLTCHRFIIASITVSSKGLCDTFCTNSLYAKVGGISVSELNVLEREFLAKIDWRLMVSSFFVDSFAFCRGVFATCRSSRRHSPQCTREVLQEYYVNLVRTHSGGQFFVVGAPSSNGSISSDSDAEMDTTQSRPPTPPRGLRNRVSTILVDRDSSTLVPEVSRRPTIEQNMAFAALQQQSSQVEPDDSDAASTNT